MGITAKHKELTASQITREVLLRFRALGYTVWRQTNNSGRRWKNQVNPGVSDIVGFSHRGLIIACEVKTIGDRFSRDQIAFLKSINDGGGGAYYATEEMGKVVIKTFNETVI